MNNENIEVTVYCLAFNHERYIRKALEGFVNQKTNFRYQVIVHDDASTDKTSEIIEEYYLNYPDLIVPIFQKENQYSQNVNIVSTYIAPLIKGKYIAVCEGDDYWCNEYKLQKQFDIMESNDTYSACVHNTQVIDLSSGKKTIKYPCNGCYVLNTVDVLQRGSEKFHTSSLFYRQEYLILPERYQIPSIGDYSKAIYLATVGNIYYISDVMSVYRKNVPGAWSTRQNNGTRYNIAQKSIKVLKAADKDTNYRYHLDIEQIIRRKEFYSLLYHEDYKGVINQYSDLLSKELSSNERIKIYIKSYIPYVNSIYKAIRNIFDKSHHERKKQ